MNVFLILEHFYAFNNSEWKEYIKNVEDENYFQKLELFAHFLCTSKSQISLAY